ncbi:pyridoxamine 5'-phosphate oxidase family protein [Planotetraspora sp. A-T 1434]|uniref:pyridoxamine 5'-phosphate oxidase family protein n=1 Tax=Planotetraspora sp. A-T 1434 TaxID=2979219 RepID=UPI0021BF2DDC|nr:pyridoxamine 5'-phosphate oxidase family protein [Planotetraspora sp. A-T 1434]MCT9933093.1 pyridoxamine 5'-phosphate oxidase family protein [Planotetraspora sp. A-T 1434]
MASWQTIEQEIPELAAKVRSIMGKHKHKTMATLRKDGSPRISGTEVEFKDGEAWVGSMLGAVKALDLRRDPRLALHSGSDDPDEANPGAWSGDAKLAGRAVEVADPEVHARYGGPPGQEFHLFRIDVTEVVVTRVDEAGEHLVIEVWHEGTGHRVIRRK